jgi:hypothetical protein
MRRGQPHGGSSPSASAFSEKFFSLLKAKKFKPDKALRLVGLFFCFYLRDRSEK